MAPFDRNHWHGLTEIPIGILRLAKSHPQRIEKACTRALKGARFNYSVLKNILDNNMDMREDPEIEFKKIPEHENLRGADAYK
ncbi:hypothetical protein HMPREF9714_01445 [Myroides odoratimimus CCUG 12901]|uniref:hypothetical protein n=1 Tax=Myroides odoratimimus TaxID=76832 RepID=UPI0002460957|nr:hypothetical protein [Myroides odoratimimus]EHO11016.1 hypothetical protein HMPREF9714_01445 [Myroides odoratimimus CCUG 12901]